MKLGLVAGEASGDLLGAGLITAIRARADVRCVGVAGPGMQAAGCEAWHEASELAVMGLAEVVSHLPRLLRLRRGLVRRFLDERPDVFVGIDAPDFNLGLERRLRARGMRTVHYVSPSVWAWRPRRAAKMASCVDAVLCLFPFEPAFYADHGVVAEFVGHPLADRIPLESPPLPARRALGLAEEGSLVALLPGSRASELKRLGPVFAQTAALLHTRLPGVRFVAAMANDAARTQFGAAIAQFAADVPVALVDGRAQEVMTAADSVLVASGTATLEALLVKRPMVVAYRVAGATRLALEKLDLLSVEHFSLPNLLAGKALVPEVIQDDVNAARLADEVEQLLRGGPDPEFHAECVRVHQQLRRDASARAAECVLRVARGEHGGAGV